MTEELKQAAQEALEALRNAQQLEHLVDRKMQRAAITALERDLTAAQPAQAGEVDERCAPHWTVSVEPVAVSGETDAHCLRASIGNQSFHIGPDYMETKQEAEFFAEMLLHAIEVGHRASLPTQPAAQAAKPDLSGHDAFDVLSQGYPTHPADCRCTWCKGKPAAQATPEPVGAPFAWTSMGQIRFTPPTQDHDTYTPLYTHPAPGVPDDVQHEIAAALALFPINITGQSFVVSGFNDGKLLEADGDTFFFSQQKVIALLEKLHTHLAAAQAKGGGHAR